MALGNFSKIIHLVISESGAGAGEGVVINEGGDFFELVAVPLLHHPVLRQPDVRVEGEGPVVKVIKLIISFGVTEQIS
jgi:hypothetical protein